MSSRSLLKRTLRLAWQMRRMDSAVAGRRPYPDVISEPAWRRDLELVPPATPCLPERTGLPAWRQSVAQLEKIPA